MRISARGRYALAAMIDIARNSTGAECCITVISIAERLGISKIYLEQVFSLLKKGGIVRSLKGAQGGYQLERPPQQITVYDILYVVESSLFEMADDTVPEKAPEIDAAMKKLIFDPMDDSLKSMLRQITLDDLMSEAENQKGTDGYMFFI